jgi:hypothetical protein
MVQQRRRPSGFIEPCLPSKVSGARTIGGGDAHRVFIAAQNCSVIAVVSSVTFQPSLCLSEIKLARTDDEIRQEMA